MKPLLRLVFPPLLVAASVLCAATCVLGVRSYSVSDDIRVRVSHGIWNARYLYLVSGKGGIGMGSMDTTRSEEGRWLSSPARSYAGDYWLCAMHADNRLGINAGVTHSSVAKAAGVVLPAWLLAPAWFIAPATVALVVTRARRRRMRWFLKWGFCRACGYDLRATPERCPECGMVPAPTSVWQLLSNP